MAISNKSDHPESLINTNSLKISDELKQFVTTLKSDIVSESTAKDTWNNKIKILRDLRYGHRTKKTTPWARCANYSIPLIDSHIQKIKPIYINLFYNSNPIVSFIPFGSEDIEPARKRESLFDWRMKTKVEFFKDYCIGIDKMLEQGSTVFKVIWEYSTRSYTEFIDLEELDDDILSALADARVTDQMLGQILVEEYGINLDFEENVKAIGKAIESFRAGDNQLEITLLEVSKNDPKVEAKDLKEDLVIPRNTTDIQYAPFIEDKIWTSKNEIKIAMEDGKYEKYTDDEINSWSYRSQGVTTNRTSYNSKNDDIVLLKEVCCWYDVNKDGIKERCVVTYPDNNETCILRFIEIPYEHGEFPYVQVRREFNDPLFYSSRGIPEIDEDFQVGISQAVNQTEDNGTIMNSPVVVTKKNTVTNLKSRKYTPGETIETVGDPADYQIRQSGNVAQPVILQFTQFLKSWADTRIGDSSAALTSNNNQSGVGAYGQKTKAEVSLIAALSNEVSSLDVLIFQMQMIKVYRQIDALYNQYGDEDEEIYMTGEKPTKVTRREIQGKFNMVAGGKIDNTDPVKRFAIAQSVLQSGINDPDIRQRELKKYYYNTIDPKLAKLLLYTDEEAAQMAQQNQVSQEQMKQLSIKTGIELSQIKMMLGVKEAAMLAKVDIEKQKVLAPIIGKPHSAKD